MHIDVTRKVMERTYERLRTYAEVGDTIGRRARAWLMFGFERETVEKIVAARLEYQGLNSLRGEVRERARRAAWKTAVAAAEEAVKKRGARAKRGPAGRRLDPGAAMLASLVWNSAAEVLDLVGRSDKMAEVTL